MLSVDTFNALPTCMAPKSSIGICARYYQQPKADVDGQSLIAEGQLPIIDADFVGPMPMANYRLPMANYRLSIVDGQCQ